VPSTRTAILNRIRRAYRDTALERGIAARGRATGGALWRSLAPSHYLYERNAIRRFRAKDLEWQVDISDYIGHGIYFGLDRSMEALFALCAEDAIVLDVGANLGWTALNLARRAARGRVIGFEADPVNYANCMVNVRLNDLPNLKVEPIGLADTPGQSHIVIDDALNRGGNRIATDGGTIVTLTTIDAYCAEHGLERVDLVKIDTEGFEERIVRGGRHVLRRDRPILFIEVNDRHLARYGGGVESLFAELRSLGYARFEIAGTGAKIGDERDLIGAHVDVIAR